MILSEYSVIEWSFLSTQSLHSRYKGSNQCSSLGGQKTLKNNELSLLLTTLEGFTHYFIHLKPFGTHVGGLTNTHYLLMLWG